MSREVDPDTWEPPPPLASPSPQAIRGTLHGSRLWEQPRYAPVAARVRALCEPGPPLNLEIGVDRGYRILGHARRWPEERWLGLELRRTIEAAAAQAPDNCLLLRGDARAVLASLVPEGRLSRVDLLFPSPSHDPRHLLLTPELVSLLGSRLGPAGVVLFATDVPGMHRWAEQLFATWTLVPEPPSGPVLSRRERRCHREARRVWRRSWGNTATTKSS